MPQNKQNRGAALGGVSLHSALLIGRFRAAPVLLFVGWWFVVFVVGCVLSCCLLFVVGCMFSRLLFVFGGGLCVCCLCLLFLFVCVCLFVVLIMFGHDLP